MQRTYWIRHMTVQGCWQFDKIVYRDKDDRPRWHKVYALEKWKQEHKGYGHLRINSVFTKQEMIAKGFAPYM